LEASEFGMKPRFDHPDSEDACLVTGCRGFLGRRLVDYLDRCGQRSIVASRIPLPDRAHVVGDITRDDLDLRGLSVSTVYHFAGKAHAVARNGGQAREFFQVNCEGTKNLLRALEQCERLPAAVVLASSVAVYGREQGSLLDEDTPRAATDPYGASKAAAEDVLLDWCERHGVRPAIVRLPLVIGPGAPGNVSAMIRALRRRRYFGVGEGAARRSMVLADDAVAALPKLAETGGVFHLTDGYHPSFAEFERGLLAALKILRAPRRLPLRAARLAARCGDVIETTLRRPAPFSSRAFTKMTSTLTFSDERARKLIGWRPTPVLERMEAIFGDS
jgi:nucleoside-diphosphate-sugar epimerase